MTSERMRRQLDRLLDEAEAAVSGRRWDEVAEKARAAIAIDADNPDALTYIRMAEANAGTSEAGAPISASVTPPPNSKPERPGTSQPTSFANGRYTVTKFLGEGGKKKVYLARDSLLDRDVAFALIKTEGLDEASRVRVQREAQAMGRLGAHPHIVTVFDIGEENGQPYLVLPVLGGGDVEGVIEKAPENKLTIERAVKIALDTCLGLEFAHSKGIVHRDLKPGNVWLTEDGRAMIGDFGLAVAVDKSRLTQAGMMVGTVSYMPPEQAMGGEVSPRSDLYSLGAMLYEMVCGRPPFVGDESVAIIGQHLNTPPVAPSWHRPDCPMELEALIVRMLEKDPTKRPASATEVREALESVTVGAPLAGARSATIATDAHSPGDNPLYRRTFVGREAELKQVQSAFDAALSGQGGLVMVVGEPGIGKTALCEQLATYVALRGGKALVGHCYEEGSLSLPYLAFVEAMRSYVLAREPDGLRSDLGTGAADVARIVSEVRDRVQDVELREAGDPEDDRWRLLQAVTSFLRNASTVQPLCIVLEDLHWADRGTLDLLLHGSRNLTGARLLIVGTYRDVEVDRSHPLSNAMGDLRRINNFARIPLRGLTAEEVQRMMAAVAQRDIPWPLAELLHRQTEGSPLFVQEMLRYLVEEGLVAESEGTLRRVGDDTLAGRIPEGLRDVIGKRLTRLGPDANRLLATASVIGRDFRLDVLQRLASMSEDNIIAALEEAKSAAVVEERSSVGAVVTYRFSHAFFSQTLYEEISAPRRIRLHQQAGRALEEVFARRLEEHAPELAEHFSHSSDAADLAKAVHYGELAAQRAMSVFDYGEASRLLERAIEVQEVLDPDDKAKRCELLLRLAGVLLPQGEAERVIESTAEEAFSLAEALHDQAKAASACRIALEGLWRSLGHSGGTSPFLPSWLERSERYVAQGTPDRIVVDAAQARVLFENGRAEEAHQRLVTAMNLARKLGDPELIYFAAWNTLLLDRSRRNERMSLELMEEFRAHVASEAGSRNLGMVMFYSTQRYRLLGEPEKAEVARDKLNALAGRIHDVNFSLYPLAAEVSRLIFRGELEEALEVAEALVQRGIEGGSAVFASTIGQTTSVSALIYLGRASSYFSDSYSELDGTSQLQARLDEAPIRQRQRVLFLAHAGRVDEAREGLHDFLNARGPGSDASEVRIPVLENMLEAAVVLRESAAAWSLAQELVGVDSVLTVRHVGEAFALVGDITKARAEYLRGLKLAEKAGHRPERALTRLSLAELLLEHYAEERDAAIEHLDFALAELRDMKMQPSLERALRHRGLLKA